MPFFRGEHLEGGAQLRGRKGNGRGGRAGGAYFRGGLVDVELEIVEHVPHIERRFARSRLSLSHSSSAASGAIYFEELAHPWFVPVSVERHQLANRVARIPHGVVRVGTSVQQELDHLGAPGTSR